MAKLNHPTNLKYSKSDEWVRVDGEEAVIGITDYAQDQLGDIVYIDLPWDGADTVSPKEQFGDIESVKATSELRSPISGTVLKVNAALKETPELINDDPYEKGWLLVIKMSNSAELDKLMNAEQYTTYLESR